MMNSDGIRNIKNSAVIFNENFIKSANIYVQTLNIPRNRWQTYKSSFLIRLSENEMLEIIS